MALWLERSMKLLTWFGAFLAARRGGFGLLAILLVVAALDGLPVEAAVDPAEPVASAAAAPDQGSAPVLESELNALGTAATPLGVSEWLARLRTLAPAGEAPGGEEPGPQQSERLAEATEPGTAQPGDLCETPPPCHLLGLVSCNVRELEDGCTMWDCCDPQ